MNLQNIKNKYGLLTLKKKRTVLGLSAGMVATLTAAAWVAFAPDRHEELAKWDDSYQRLCYTSDDEEPDLKSSMARLRLNAIERNLSASYPFGAIASGEFNKTQEDRVYCFGDRYDDEPVSNWWLTGVTIIDNNYPNNLFASNMVMDGINEFWNDHIGNVEKRLTANDALFFSRFQRAIYAVYTVDQIYKIDVLANDSNVFNTKEWEALEGHSLLGSTAKTYKEEMLSNPRDSKQALRNSLHAFLKDGDVLNEDDIKFMDRYYSHLESSHQQCISRNSDGFCNGSITIYTSPPSYVHSTSISPEILVGLSDALYGGDGFLSTDDVSDIISDDKVNILHSNDADYSWSRVYSRINEYNTKKHYKGDNINPDRLYDSAAFEKLYSQAGSPRFK